MRATSVCGLRNALVAACMFDTVHFVSMNMHSCTCQQDSSSYARYAQQNYTTHQSQGYSGGVSDYPTSSPRPPPSQRDLYGSGRRGTATSDVAEIQGMQQQANGRSMMYLSDRPVQQYAGNSATQRQQAEAGQAGRASLHAPEAR